MSCGFPMFSFSPIPGKQIVCCSPDGRKEAFRHLCFGYWNRTHYCRYFRQGNRCVPCWREEGDMGRYVAINDPGQPAAGYPSYEAYQAAVNAGQARPATSVVSASVVGPQPGIVSTPLLAEKAYVPAGSFTSDEANVEQPVVATTTNKDVPKTTGN